MLADGFQSVQAGYARHLRVVEDPDAAFYRFQRVQAGQACEERVQGNLQLSADGPDVPQSRILQRRVSTDSE